jgi:hypothetical protein
LNFFEAFSSDSKGSNEIADWRHDVQWRGWRKQANWRAGYSQSGDRWEGG